MDTKIGKLKKGLLITQGLTLIKEGFIKYSTIVDSDDRRAALSNICRTFEIAERVAGSHETLIEFAPIDMSVHKYILDCKNDFKSKLMSVTPPYGLPTHLENYSWDSPYEIHKDDKFEKLTSTAVIRNSTNEVKGTFTFVISLYRYKSNDSYVLNLPLVYVRPQYRNGTGGLDLSIAVSKLATEIYSNVLLSSEGNKKTDVVIEADYTSKSGGRLGDLIADEFEVMFDEIRNVSPRYKKIGRLDLEMGF